MNEKNDASDQSLSATTCRLKSFELKLEQSHIFINESRKQRTFCLNLVFETIFRCNDCIAICCLKNCYILIS